MKKILDRLFLGYLLQVPFIIVMVACIYIFRFFDSFYNMLIVQWIIGRSVTGLGFFLGTAVALLFAFLISNQKGWHAMSTRLRHVSLLQFFINIVEKWRVFRELANTQGAILAPYYREHSTFYPAVVTGVTRTEKGTYLVSVVFGDLPFPKPFLLDEAEIVYTKLGFRDAVAYTLSWGLASELFKDGLKEETLGNYIRRSAHFV